MRRWLCVLGCGLWVATGLGAQGLPEPVAQALARARLPATALQVVVAPVQGNAMRWRHQAQTEVNPASLMKLLTTSAALELLGPSFVWRTSVWVDGTVRDGVLQGDVYVQGQGDPKLVSERLWLLWRRVRALGIERIEGDLVLDRSAFEVAAADPGSFDGEPHRPYNAQPDGLLVNYKSVVMHWAVDEASQRARVHLEPPLAGLRTPQGVALGAGPCTDYRATLKADFSRPLDWQFQGVYPRECGERVWPVAFGDPASHAGRALEGVWRAVGGTLTGRVREGRVPTQARRVLVFESPPLQEVVRDINKFSNNLMAEQLFLTLSWHAQGVGRVEASRELLQSWWNRKTDGMPLAVDNGSGLSRVNRLTAEGLAILLQRMWASPWMPELVSSLPVSGQDGTLRRSKSEALAHLKTGSLRDVLGVAGYVEGEQGQRWVLVAILTHPQAQGGRGVLDALVDWTARGGPHQP